MVRSQDSKRLLQTASVPIVKRWFYYLRDSPSSQMILLRKVIPMFDLVCFIINAIAATIDNFRKPIQQ